MFVLSWIRSSDAQQASTPANDSSSSPAPALARVPLTDNMDIAGHSNDDRHQEDWVFLPSDHQDLMESSVSDLDFLSASMTLYRPSSTAHPASSRTRTETTISTSSSSAVAADNTSGEHTKKSRRQLKQEIRQKQAAEALERRPRYDPMIAKMRDQELKMAKMAKLSLRSGKVMSSNTGGTRSAKSLRGSGTSLSSDPQ
ncbi:hypothetical protein BG011_006102 [Mortierella polycephala]|uniref:Uncharacterized protein n=1 Tax=Mortierella polycephala TaxID=41804 RepID=A0A9P6PVQ6_9FUNG|nr:hypothetical protein BG011_006102 [Mortierella polycephala]